jgi:MFS family permease
LTPGYTVGAISLVVLGLAVFARYRRHLSGAWRWVYIVTAMIALYLNVFVLIVQCFLKIPALHALAPTQTEPPFEITQLAVLALFIVLTILALIRFHPNESNRNSPLKDAFLTSQFFSTESTRSRM